LNNVLELIVHAKKEMKLSCLAATKKKDLSQGVIWYDSNLNIPYCSRMY